MTARRRKPDARAALLAYVRPDREAVPPEDDPNYMRNVRRLLNRLLRQRAQAAVDAAQDSGPAECARIRAAVLRGTRGKR